MFELQELGHQATLIRGVAKKVFLEMGSFVDYKVGTMIEIPRAAFVADEVIPMQLLLDVCTLKTPCHVCSRDLNREKPVAKIFLNEIVRLLDCWGSG